MDNIIDVSIPVAEVVDKHPEVLEILVELGFKPLANPCLLYTSPSPRDATLSRMPSSA